MLLRPPGRGTDVGPLPVLQWSSPGAPTGIPCGGRRGSSGGIHGSFAQPVSDESEQLHEFWAEKTYLGYSDDCKDASNYFHLYGRTELGHNAVVGLFIRYFLILILSIEWKNRKLPLVARWYWENIYLSAILNVFYSISVPFAAVASVKWRVTTWDTKTALVLIKKSLQGHFKSKEIDNKGWRSWDIF